MKGPRLTAGYRTSNCSAEDFKSTSDLRGQTRQIETDGDDLRFPERPLYATEGLECPGEQRVALCVDHCNWMRNGAFLPHPRTSAQLAADAGS